MFYMSVLSADISVLVSQTLTTKDPALMSTPNAGVLSDVHGCG